MFIASNGETAWPLDRAIDAVTWVASQGLAILGGEAWLVDADRGITGLIPLVGSTIPGVRGWTGEDRRPSEAWANYVDRCLRHAVAALRAEQASAPTEIPSELMPHLRYNFTFAHEAGMTDPGAPLITGDYYIGADGPQIILFLHSRSAVEWLDAMFRNAAEGSASIDLTRDSRVQVNGLAGLRLGTRDSGPSMSVRLVEHELLPTFEWSATKDGWLTCSGLIRPFLEGEHGHQYFDYEGIHDAVIEVSYGERWPTGPG